jgi:hypothetical protein
MSIELNKWCVTGCWNATVIMWVWSNCQNLSEHTSWLICLPKWQVSLGYVLSCQQHFLFSIFQSGLIVNRLLRVYCMQYTWKLWFWEKIIGVLMGVHICRPPHCELVFRMLYACMDVPLAIAHVAGWISFMLGCQPLNLNILAPK